MKDVFALKRIYRYNSKEIFVTNNIHTEHYGKESLSYLGPKIWKLIPDDIKTLTTLKCFNKKKIEHGYQIIVHANYVKPL